MALKCSLLLLIKLIKLVDLLQLKEIRMPGVSPTYAEQYLCKAVKLSTSREHYIIGFEPHATMHTAHHMLLFGCTSPGYEEQICKEKCELFRDCGEMSSQGQWTAEYPTGQVCAEGSSVIYAWARDAPHLELPEGVGFKTGGQTGIQYLVLQVHYMHKISEPDYSGITVKSTTQETPKKAAVLLMGTDGTMKAHSKENFETACIMDDEGVELHPFAFRTHTHKHGRLVSGYVIDGETSIWKLIGKKDPQLPQMFYPVENKNLIIKTNDVIAARCAMVNEDDRSVSVGSTGDDEMCNFYLMYWQEKGRQPDQNTCFSPGPPNYYWKKQAGLKNIPND